MLNSAITVLRGVIKWHKLKEQYIYMSRKILRYTVEYK